MPQPQDKLHAVAVEHLPKDCPLDQLTPEAAHQLADRLEQSPSTGVFSMKLHHGIVLVETDNPDEVVELFTKALPNHLPPEVKDVSHNPDMQALYDNAQQLDDEASRHRLLALAHDEFPHKGFDKTQAEGLPTLPLSSQAGTSLPDYLKANAPGK